MGTFLTVILEMIGESIGWIKILSMFVTAIIFVLAAIIRNYFRKKTADKQVVPSGEMTVFIFVIGSLLLSYLYFTLQYTFQIIWIDFMNYNPHRSQEHALDLLMWGPIKNFLIVLFFMILPIVFAIILVAFSHLIWKYVPLCYVLFIIVPICSYLYYAVLSPALCSRFELFFYLKVFLEQLPIWVGCWWWSNSSVKS